jgi:hypothetical protein
VVEAYQWGRAQTRAQRSLSAYLWRRGKARRLRRCWRSSTPNPGRRYGPCYSRARGPSASCDAGPVRAGAELRESETRCECAAWAEVFAAAS